MSKTMPKAYSYTRMSTPEQLKGDSRRRQVESANRYAEKRGWEVVDRFDDIGVSAFHGKNAQFGALSFFLGAVQEGKVERGSVLIVESIDRLSRQDVGKALPLLLDLIRHGITVVTLHPEQEYSEEAINDGGMSLIGALFIMARSHEESRTKSIRGREAWKQKRINARESGRVTTRKVPGWLVVEGGKVRVNEARAEVVREIFGMAKDGWGAFSISRHLNERGEQPWGTRKSAVWRESYIKKLLRSRTVLGEYQPHTVHIEAGRQVRASDGEPIHGYYPAVVDLDLFHEVAHTLEARRLVGRGRKGDRYANLFTGLLRCHCGAGYRFVDKGRPPKGGEYLQCSVALAKGRCSMPLLRYGAMEDFLLSYIDNLDARRLVDDGEADARLSAARSRRSELIEQIATSKRKLENLISFIEEHGAGGGSTRVKKQLDQEELTAFEAESELESLEREIESLQRASAQERREALSRLVVEMRQGGAAHVQKRRALAEEIRRLVERVVIRPSTHVLEEIFEGGADGSMDGEAPIEVQEWREKYGVATKTEMRKLLKDRSFEVSIFYRTGASERIDALDGPYFKAQPSRRMKELKLVNG